MAEGRMEHLKTPKSYRDTEVPVNRTVNGLERLLQEFGCESRAVTTAHHDGEALVAAEFSYRKRLYRIRLSLGRDPKAQRQRMRMLYWYVKALLEAVLFGVVSAEEALLPYAAISDGQGGVTTVARATLPMLEAGGSAVDPTALFEALRPRPALPAPRDGQ